MSGVRGPNSALTEFLRSQGISANEISRRYAYRQSREGEQENIDRETEIVQQQVENEPQDPEVRAIAEAAARKRRQDADGPGNEGTALCAFCQTRFTITVFTREAPGGKGWLCRTCGASSRKPAKRTGDATAKRRRKQLAAALLDLRNSVAPTLQELCINTVAQYIDDVEELGELSVSSLNRIARILCKNRRLTPHTIQLFLRPEIKSLEFWDCSGLTPEAINLITSMCPNIETLALGMCGQMIDENLERLASGLPRLQNLYLDGPFLIRKSAWMDFFDSVGPRLKKFALRSVYRIDVEALAVMIESFKDSLESLSLSRLSQLADSTPFFMLSDLESIKELELMELDPGAWSDAALVSFLNGRGHQLTKLVIDGDESIGDSVIDAIAQNCVILQHLELKRLPSITEESVIRLFEGWDEAESNLGLTTLSLERCITLGDPAISAALNHARTTLVDVNINSLKLITPNTLVALAELPNLTRLDIGFVGCADPVHIYKLSTCKSLRLILAFGNIHLTGMPLPQGVTVLGTM